jgi:peptide deformylase
MILPIVRYGHPVLRQKGVAVDRVTPEIRQLVADMLDTMYAAHGVGLAAHQVGQAIQLTVLDIRGVKERPSTLALEGKDADPESIMPLILLNPEVKPVGDLVAGPEGCLSFPEIYAEVVRPEAVDVRATDLDGCPVLFRCGGLLAKAIQHEVDHLNGVLYIDRMTREVKAEIRGDLEYLMAETKEDIENGGSREPRRVVRPRRGRAAE